MDDRSIISLYENRSERAIEETRKEYGKLCFSIAMNHLGTLPDAEEAVNDAYLAVWESIPPEQPESLKSYLAKIVKHICLNRIEAARAEKRAYGTAAVFEELSEVITTEEEDLVEALALKEALHRFLASLKRTDRALFVKRYWFNESIAAIAYDANMTKTAVKTKLHRLRKQLKNHLKNEGVLPRRLYETD